MNAKNQLLETLLEERVKFRSYIRKYLNKDDSFDDVYQELCVKALSKKLSPNNIKSYLYRTAYNQIIDTYRQKKVFKREHDQYFLYKKMFLQKSENHPIEFSSDVFAYARKNLEARFYYPIKLRYKQGLRIGEIAEALHLKTTTVSSYISVGLKVLKKKLQASEIQL